MYLLVGLLCDDARRAHFQKKIPACPPKTTGDFGRVAGAGRDSYRVAAARGCFGATFCRKSGQIPLDGEAGAREYLPEGVRDSLVHMPDGVRQVVKQEVLVMRCVSAGCPQWAQYRLVRAAPQLRQACWAGGPLAGAFSRASVATTSVRCVE